MDQRAQVPTTLSQSNTNNLRDKNLNTNGVQVLKNYSQSKNVLKPANILPTYIKIQYTLTYLTFFHRLERININFGNLVHLPVLSGYLVQSATNWLINPPATSSPAKTTTPPATFGLLITRILYGINGQEHTTAS